MAVIVVAVVMVVTAVIAVIVVTAVTVVMVVIWDSRAPRASHSVLVGDSVKAGRGPHARN